MYTSKTMSADRCSEMILQAAWKRQRELVMPPGRLAEWLKLLAPAWLDRLAVERFLRPAVRREQSR
jgi:short-subunit dehydrogenase